MVAVGKGAEEGLCDDAESMAVLIEVFAILLGFLYPAQAYGDPMSVRG